MMFDTQITLYVCLWMLQHSAITSVFEDIFTHDTKQIQAYSDTR